jgi:hypothetical protein
MKPGYFHWIKLGFCRWIELDLSNPLPLRNQGSLFPEREFQGGGDSLIFLPARPNQRGGKWLRPEAYGGS